MPISYNSLVSSKTMFRTTLTSGTSYTVPAGVTYLNVTLVGAGGGGGGGYDDTAGYTRDVGETGCGGQIISSTLSATAGASIAYTIGAGGAGGVRTASAAYASAGGNTTFTGATTATGGAGGNSTQAAGATGTAAQSASNGGVGGGWGSAGAAGGTGGAGCIYVEYWAQEITMRTFAVIEDNTVVNIIVGVEDEVVAANPGKYIDYTDGWDYNNGIDGGVYFPTPTEPDA